MAVTVKVNIDHNKITTYIRTAVDEANKELGPKLQQYARQHHRYKNQTGNLTNSTVVRDVRQGLELYASASYAGYIHNGFKSWSPDPWLEKTIKENDKLIIDTYNKYIADAMKRM